MASCDMCGKPATTKARIEGAIMNVCASCATFGVELNPPKVVGRAPIGPRPVHGLRSSEGEFVLAGDVGNRLRSARRRMNLTEEEAALKLGISKNDLLHYESGKLQPNETMTRRLEKFYGVTLRIQV